jgi:predicted RNA polymerase sigma factor
MMAQARLSMRKIEEILRLKYEMGLTHREIARSCAVSASTVSECVTHAKAAGLSWPLPEGLGGEKLEALLYSPSAAGQRCQISEPDWQYVHKERRGEQIGGLPAYTMNLLKTA